MKLRPMAAAAVLLLAGLTLHCANVPPTPGRVATSRETLLANIQANTPPPEITDQREMLAELRPGERDDAGTPPLGGGREPVHIALGNALEDPAESETLAATIAATERFRANLPPMRSPERVWQWPLETFTYVRGLIPARNGRRAHRGVDLAAPRGTPILAMAPGRVIRAGWGLTGYGRWVVIDHGNGYKSLYAHCSRVDVEVGDHVRAGQRIAAIGATGRATGSHLHFEIRLNDRPIDPEPLLPPR